MDSSGISQKGSTMISGTPSRKKTLNGSSTPGNGRKQKLSPAGQNYTAGSRVEAKDFNGQWCTAKISEVDWEEKEILIHFDNFEKDEWMSMDSQRVRPYKEPDAPSLHPANPTFERNTGFKGHYFPEPKPVERRFKNAERVMATWSNNRKYPATIIAPQPDDRYDVIFDDGFRKSVRGSKISKMKDSDQMLTKQRSQEDYRQQIMHAKHHKSLQMQHASHRQHQASLHPPPHGLLKSHLENGSLLSPIIPLIPKSPTQTGLSQIEKRLPSTGVHYNPPAQHSAPIVDGLLPIDENIGTKEQRRERKRKINVKELFTTKRPRGSEKQGSTSKSYTDSKKHSHGSNAGRGPPVSSTYQTPSSNDHGANGLLLGVDPMFPANPMKVEGLPPQLKNHDSMNDKPPLEASNVEKRKRKMFKKKRNRLLLGDAQPSSTSIKRSKHQPSGDEDECSIQWTNGEPQGEAAYVIESAEGPRKSIIVEDRRLPDGWCKHAIRRQGGSSAGKWDVFLVSPMDGRKFRSRNELRSYHDEHGLQFQVERFDFSLGRKKTCRQKAAAAARGTGQEDRSDSSSQAGDSPSGSSPLPPILHPPAPHSVTPQITPLGMQRVKTLLPRARSSASSSPNRRVMSPPPPHAIAPQPIMPTPPAHVAHDALIKKSLSASSDGFVCPKDGCHKRLRNENLLQMHFKHYHPEYNAFMGSTPNVADLAYARTVGEPVAEMPNRNRGQISSSFMEKIEKISRMEAHRKVGTDGTTPCGEPTSSLEAKSPTLGLLLKQGPMRKDSVDGTTAAAQAAAAWMVETASESAASLSSLPDSFRDRASQPCHTVTTDSLTKEMKIESGSRPASRTAGLPSESDQDASNEPSTPSPWKLGTPDGPGSASASCSPVTVQPSSYFYSKKKRQPRAMKNEEGKPSSPTADHLRRGELINCTCGITEEDGLMIQCDLCLCWQHGICNKIENIEDVPHKYVCQICVNPIRERRSRHFIHDQDWLKEGYLPSFTFTKRNLEKQRQRDDILKRSHELCALLLQTQKVIHSLRVKVHIAEQKDHPKLYLWASSWEKESSGCSTTDTAGAEVKVEPKLEPIVEAMCTNGWRGKDDDVEDVAGIEGKGKSLLQEALLNGSPHQQLQHHHHQLPLGLPHPYAPDAPRVPQPEAPIDPGECRLKLLDHIEHYQSLIDARLSILENMIDSLEKEDPTLLDEKHSQTAIQPFPTGSDLDDPDLMEDSQVDSFPQTKETVQMILKDLLNLKKISTL